VLDRGKLLLSSFTELLGELVLLANLDVSHYFQRVVYSFLGESLFLDQVKFFTNRVDFEEGLVVVLDVLLNNDRVLQ